MPLTSSRSSDGKELVIEVVGRFDFSLQRAFRDACNSVDSRKVRYRIDLSRSDYIDSAALGMLLLLREQVGAEGAGVRISGCGTDVERTLQVSRFYQLFEMVPAQ
ncbi:MAG: STAS domain-containing protein [Gammaproteobacteria bacterium]|nr:STAS domain-containing protein [Gammaproteobacteria bacterium]MCB1851010.1 STAS domain-containing protein [Gammaproteobacteria bacterium]